MKDRQTVNISDDLILRHLSDGIYLDAVSLEGTYTQVQVFLEEDQAKKLAKEIKKRG